MKYVIYKQMIERPDISLHLKQNEIEITVMGYAGHDYIRVILENEDASVLKLKFPDVKMYAYHPNPK